MEEKEACMFCALQGIVGQLLGISEHLKELVREAVKDEENKNIVSTIGKDLNNLSGVVNQAKELLTIIYHQEHDIPRVH